MNIHEYQAKIILQKYGIPTPNFIVISEPSQIQEALDQLDHEEGVVKAQVHAGGRGKAGGVKIGRSKAEMRELAENMLQMKLVTQQTGKEGIKVNELLISPLVEIKKEYYLGATIDRKHAQAVLIISPEGGVDIEEVAAHTPDKILTVPITPQGKIRNYQLLQIMKFMHWQGPTAEQGKRIIIQLAKIFTDTDADLIEINPLIETKEGNLIALDAKLSVDENALFRQPEIAQFFDPTQISPLEARAKEFDLAYVAMDGEIGCMVNGAGLAMATMDIIHYYGGSPANFLDVGGGASQAKVAEGFKIILSDSKVKSILVNIFGGIMNCVTLAAGIIAAASEADIGVPLVLRMEGTNVEQGKKMLLDSGINIHIADSLGEGARLAVELAKGK